MYVFNEHISTVYWTALMIFMYQHNIITPQKKAKTKIVHCIININNKQYKQFRNKNSQAIFNKY